MKLKNAAKFFDTCPVYDAYTGALLFKVQTSTFLESSLEGSTASRRVVSLAPEITPPAHSCILALNQLLLLGGENPDEWAGSAIRRAYWTKRITDSFRVRTPAQVLNSVPGTAVYGQRKYLRESINTQTDSELDPTWDIFLSKSLAPSRGMFISSATVLYRVRVSYEDVDGFRTCQSDEVDEPIRTMTFTTSSSYDPVTDSYAPATVTLPSILLDYSKVFSKADAYEDKAKAGDICAVIGKSLVVPSVGQTIGIEAASRYRGNWQILKVSDELDARLLHLRRV